MNLRDNYEKLSEKQKENLKTAFQKRWGWDYDLFSKIINGNAENSKEEIWIIWQIYSLKKVEAIQEVLDDIEEYDSFDFDIDDI